MEKDDRLIRLIYVAFAPLALFTAIFGPLLVLFPESTRVYWAWEIKPAMSAVWVGAGYTFGSIAIITMLIVGRWRSARIPVIATWPFSIVVLGATLLHWDRFFQGTLNFYIWFVIYLVLPFALPLAWWLNRKHDPGPQPEDVLVPRSIVITGAIIGIIVGLLSLLAIFSPGTVAGFWPWQLTPLMSRIVGAWLLFIAMGLLSLTFERRYVAYRYYLVPAAIWFALLFAVSFLHLNKFNFNQLTSWAWFVATAGASLLMLALFAYMERFYKSRAQQVLTPATGP